MLRLVTFTIALFLINRNSADFLSNNYKIEVDNVEVCPNNDQLPYPIKNLKYARYNRTHKALSFDFVYGKPIDENVGGGINIDRWGDGGWKKIPFLGLQPNVCKNMLNYFKTPWVTLHEKAGVKHPDKCPVPAGNYSLKNYVINTDGISIPFWNGRFRLMIYYQDIKTKQILICYLYYTRVIEEV